MGERIHGANARRCSIAHSFLLWNVITKLNCRDVTTVQRRPRRRIGHKAHKEFLLFTKDLKDPRMFFETLCDKKIFVTFVTNSSSWPSWPNR